MLYEFKSRAAGTVTMTAAVAERLLAIVGKTPGPHGVFTVEQMGPAISALQAAVAREKAESAPDDDDDRDRRDGARSVSLAQRAWPLIELLRAAMKAEQVVTWGV